jgi:hypothetical protein
VQLAEKNRKAGRNRPEVRPKTARSGAVERCATLHFLPALEKYALDLMSHHRDVVPGEDDPAGVGSIRLFINQ